MEALLIKYGRIKDLAQEVNRYMKNGQREMKLKFKVDM